MRPKVRMNYDPSEDPGISFPTDPANVRTKQSFKDECDINNIMKQAALQGELPPNLRDELYGDYSQVPDYQEALNIIAHADLQFSSLDASIRARFNNSPIEFLGYATDPTNLKGLVALGLAVEKPATPSGMTTTVVASKTSQAAATQPTPSPAAPATPKGGAPD